MNRIKSTFAIILCLIMALGMFAGCSGKPEETKRTHDQQTYVLNGSETGKTVPHNFVDGKCTLCDETTVFRQEPISATKEILQYQAAEGHRGQILEVWYKTRAYGVEHLRPEYEGQLHIVKRCYVYLPANYDPNRAEPYNVLFKMHGNKLNEGYWFRQGTYAEESAWSCYTGGYGTENMLDYMFDQGIPEDLIVVTPTMYNYYYNDKQGDILGGDADVGNLYSGYIDPDFERVEAAVTKLEGDDSVWWKEFQYDLLPYIVNNFNTYAKSSSEEDMIAARDHVGFTGLSRGGGICKVMLRNCVPFISYFGWESGCIIPPELAPDVQYDTSVETHGGLDPDWFVKYNSELKENYPIHYFFISCGSSENPNETCDAMIRARDALGLKDGSDIANGDAIAYVTINGTAHNYATWITDFWNELFVFFKAPV